MWLVLALPALAATLQVCPADPSCEYPTVRDALAASVDGDTLSLAGGTYTEWLTIDRSVTILARDASDRPLLRAPLGDAQTSLLVVDGTAGPVDVGLIGVDLLGFGVRPIEVHSASLTMEDAHVTASGFQVDGGLLWAEDAHLELTRSIWVGGEAMLDGGQLFVRDTTLSLRGNHFLRGFAGQDGGSVAASGVSEVRSVNDRFERNEALGLGGAIALRSAGSPLALVTQQSNFIQNQADDGGGVHALGSATVDLFASVFEGNHANGAGAIGTVDGDLYLVGCFFKWNTTQLGAGAVGVQGARENVVTHTRFCENGALSRGSSVAQVAGSATPESRIEWTNNLFFENSTADGGTIASFGNAIELRNNTFVRNTTAPLVGELEYQDLTGRIRNNLFFQPTGAIVSEGASVERLAYNAYWSDTLRDPPGASPVTADPRLRPTDSEGCAWATQLPTWRSPLVDAGDPALSDPDGTRSNIGVYGGPKQEASLQVVEWSAWWYDNDEDGELLLYDCNDEDVAFGPQIAEVWYDGVDQDCDYRSDYDQDLDGHDSANYGGDDCDDLDPTRAPGTIDLPHNGVDEDCSGADLSDADGDGVSAQVLVGDKTPFADCDDTDPSVYPGALELDDDIDHDCDGFTAPPRRLGVRGCDTGHAAPSFAAWLALTLLAGRRRARVA